MNTWIEWLNHWGSCFTGFALPMLAQSSILISLLLTIDIVLRKRVRATVRYALWVLVLVKLLLPPTLTSPTGVAYWLPKSITEHQPVAEPVTVVSAPGNSTVSPPSVSLANGSVPPPLLRPSVTLPALLLSGWLIGLTGLALWVAWRSWHLARSLRATVDSPDRLKFLANSCRHQLGINRPISVRLSPTANTAAICGLLNPVIIVPVTVSETLTDIEMRSVLLHELAHYRRGDLWVGSVQIGLQIFYWYNPLLWLVNRIIRRIREQAVDELVLVELKDAAEIYPATLVRMAQMALARENLGIGVMGIFEPVDGLKDRINHILERPVPRSARLGLQGLIPIILTAAALLPMASKATDSTVASTQLPTDLSIGPKSTASPHSLSVGPTSGSIPSSESTIFGHLVAADPLLEEPRFSPSSLSDDRHSKGGSTPAPASPEIVTPGSRSIIPLTSAQIIVPNANPQTRSHEVLVAELNPSASSHDSSPASEPNRIQGAPPRSTTIMDQAALDQPPMPLSQPCPVYPYDFKKEGIMGAVLLEFLVYPDGSVKNPVVLTATIKDARSGKPGPFANAAIKGVTKWKFKPGMKDGQPIVARVQVPIVFRLTGELYELSALDQRPVATYQAQPVYPYAMKKAGVAATVFADFVVDKNGRVSDIFAVSTTGQEFEANVIRAVKSWKFRPGMLNGRPVKTHMMVPIQFALDDPYSFNLLRS